MRYMTFLMCLLCFACSASASAPDVDDAGPDAGCYPTEAHFRVACEGACGQMQRFHENFADSGAFDWQKCVDDCQCVSDTGVY